MKRRSITVPIITAFAITLLQAVTMVIATPTTASASVRPVAGCPLSQVALARIAAGDQPFPACAWPAVAETADVSVLHEECTIVGTEAADVIEGTSGKDVICGYQGDDVIKALAGGDVVYGGAGKDRMRGGPGGDEMHGEAGNDRLYGGLAGDRLYGQMGNDRLFGEGWSDYLSGAYGNDYISGGPGSDYAFDSYGFELAELGAGGDQWYSVRGQDVVYAGRGNDWCITVFDDLPGDVIDGGRGTDDVFDADVGDTVTGFEIGPEACYGC